MKEGTFYTKLVMLVLGGILAVYFGAHLWKGLTDPMVTTTAYAYTVNDSAEAEGFLIREEQVLPSRSGITDVVLSEGEKVGRGQTIAVFYRDSQALEREEQIKALEMEVELLQYALSQTGGVASTAELEGNVVRALAALRADAAAGDFTHLEDRVLELKHAVLKRDYTYGEADTSRLAALEGQLHSLRSRSAQDTSRVTASQPGTFSSLVDGYESLLTPQSAAGLTPSALDALAARPVSGDSSAVGKLITSSTWYFAAPLSENAAQRLTPGKTVTVRFSGDFSQDVEMRVVSVGEAENGRAAVLLSSNRSLAGTTLLRRQTVELIFRQYQGLRVPTSAVHMVTRTSTDKETGETVQSTVTGVYTVVNGRAEFKAVEVLAEGSQFYVVRPADSGKAALRAGDTVIAQAKGLYDGKVVYG